MREHREPTPQARRRHKELVTEEMLDNEMAILEGMQALPSEEVANEGARGFRKVNLERFKAKLQDQYLEGKGVDASQALAEAMGSIQEAQRTTLLEVSAWPDDLRQALELDDPEDIPQIGDIKEKYVLSESRRWHRPPLSVTNPGGDQPMSQQDLNTEEGKLSLLLWAMKRHQGELRMFVKKHTSGEIPRGADQQFKLTPEELLALERRTHPLTCERDHIDPVIYTALEI